VSRHSARWHDLRNDADQLIEGLRDRFEALAEVLLGPPNRQASTRRTLRFGAKGSVAVELTGKKRGVWFDHEAGAGGGPLQLIRHVHGSSIDEAITWARTWLRQDMPLRYGPSPEPSPEPVLDQFGIAAAQKIWRESRGPYGTSADSYLTKVRKIPRPATGWPSSVAYHPQTRSLVLATTTDTGMIQAVHRVPLTADGKNKRRPPDEKHPEGCKIELTRGPLAGAVGKLAGTVGSPLLLGEGLETALSGWMPTNFETWVTLGPIGRVIDMIIEAVKKNRSFARLLVVLADDDQRNSASAQALRKAVSRGRRAGLNLTIATPWAVRRGDKSDFNDLMQAGGPEAVKARIDRALGRIPVMWLGRRSVTDARLVVDETVRTWAAVAMAWQQTHGRSPGQPPP
jgi:putative DNA primase/helicase